jgi:hypothetical protein
MPITDDIMDHDLLGPAIRPGGLNMVRRQATRLFGPIPEWPEDCLHCLSIPETENLSLRLYDAKTIEDLFTF